MSFTVGCWPSISMELTKVCFGVNCLGGLCCGRSSTSYQSSLPLSHPGSEPRDKSQKEGPREAPAVPLRKSASGFSPVPGSGGLSPVSWQRLALSRTVEGIGLRVECTFSWSSQEW